MIKHPKRKKLYFFALSCYIKFSRNLHSDLVLFLVAVYYAGFVVEAQDQPNSVLLVVKALEMIR